MEQPTQHYCPLSGAKPGEDNSTHHLVIKGSLGSRGYVCRYCGKTERQLREELNNG